MAPRSRKRLAKMNRAAAAIGCCLMAAASASSAASVDVPPYRVTPNTNNRRKKSEDRRRLEQDYYRQLSSKQAQQQQQQYQEDALLGEADVNDEQLGSSLRGNPNHDHDDVGSEQYRRQLPVNHKKKKTYADNSAASTHKKGNSDSNGGYMVMGASSSTSNQNANKEPLESAPAAQTNKQEENNNNEPENLNSATSLRKFTRSGYSGFTLPRTKRHPYMASLQLEGHNPNGKFDIHMCGGVLVSSDLIMTSAHCANFQPPGSNEVHSAFNGIELGKTDLSDEGVPFDPYSLDTYKLYYENLIPQTNYVHPQYNEDSYEHDVMLVKVFGQSRFPPVRVRGEEMDSKHVTVLGFGAENANSQQKFSNVLRSADMTLMTNDKCRNIRVSVTDPTTGINQNMGLREHVFDDMMCARRSNNDQRNICYGDAGGPAITSGNANEDEDDEVTGILSWGYGCVNRDYPAVMTRVSDHYNWIRQTICNHSVEPPEQYGCSKMKQFSSGGPTARVTLKLKMDRMAVETGFVIKHRDSGEIVAQRQPGYWKNEKYGNEIVLEPMDLPRDQCFVLTMLDSFGDGNCCDMGGGNAIVYWGSDVGYYTGQKMMEISGMFEFDASGDFCTSGPTSSMQSYSNHEKENPKPSPGYSYVTPSVPKPPKPAPPLSSTPRPPSPPQPAPTPQGNLQLGSGGSGNKGGGGGTWSGPAMNPEFEYCNHFCGSSAHGTMCGNYECVHIKDDEEVATSDAQGTDLDGPLTVDEYYEEDSEYYLTVQFMFDENPEEISWVLYDLTTNEVQIFVDFDVYTKDEYANKMLVIPVTMDGPEEGEKQYAFTVYDKLSNGLCCDHGEGYYKVYLGDPEDDLELLGDDEFEFSSSYYFTLFESDETDAPTLSPAADPTQRPSKKPTRRPSREPTPQPSKQPTPQPSTGSPTNIWELQRPEHMDDIGSKWTTRTVTHPGVFNDLEGDQHKFKFNADGSIRNSAQVGPSFVRKGTVVGAVLVCSLVLAMMH